MIPPKTLLDLPDYEEGDMPTNSACLECRGSGADRGDERVGYSGSDCEECGGTGRMERNWLEEALRIVSYDHYTRPEWEHLRALVVHAKELLRAQSKPAGSETAIRKPAKSTEAA